jgi:hypothetical protein
MSVCVYACTSVGVKKKKTNQAPFILIHTRTPTHTHSHTHSQHHPNTTPPPTPTTHQGAGALFVRATDGIAESSRKVFREEFGWDVLRIFDVWESKTNDLKAKIDRVGVACECEWKSEMCELYDILTHLPHTHTHRPPQVQKLQGMCASHMSRRDGLRNSKMKMDARNKKLSSSETKKLDDAEHEAGACVDARVCVRVFVCHIYSVCVCVSVSVHM